jgi:hypothetical protein
MSSKFEPPSLPEEIISMMVDLGFRHRKNPEKTVPAYICGDVSHGIPGADGTVLYNHMELFELAIPFMAEFHLKNTDARYHSTFGFSETEQKTGIVDLKEVKRAVAENADKFPVEEVTAYLEIGGPKLGRDDTDLHLGRMLEESLTAVKNAFVELTE